MNSEIKIKHCSVCDQDKPIDQFRLKKDQRKGKNPHYYYQYLCIDCQAKRDKKYRVKNRFFLEENRRNKQRTMPLYRKQKVTQTRNEILKKGRDRSHEYYYSHRALKLEYYQKNKKAISDRAKLKYQENKKLRMSYPGRRINYKNAKTPGWRQREKIVGRIILSNSYVKKLINQSTGLSMKSIPPDLVENYRMQIKVKRLLKQKNYENTETS